MSGNPARARCRTLGTADIESVQERVRGRLQGAGSVAIEVLSLIEFEDDAFERKIPWARRHPRLALGTAEGAIDAQELAMPGSYGGGPVRVTDHDRAMARRFVAALILDEHNLAEIGRHRASKAEVEQVVANRHITAPNPRGEPGSILLIGETDGGRVLTVPLVSTDDPTTWRPATPFDASRHQRTIFRRRVR